MQISKLKLEKKFEEKMYDIFFQTIADLKDAKQTESFLKDFLTKTELTTLAKRLMIANFLEIGKSYEYIKNNVKVSSATIANVDKMMSTGSKGFTIALKNIAAEEWADKTAQKVSKIINSFVGK